MTHTIPGVKDQSVVCRFVESYTGGDGNGCWLWHGPFRRGASIQPVFDVSGPDEEYRRLVPAYRFAWEVSRGAIPRTSRPLCVHRTCENLACVNPRHLELLTRAELNSILRKKRKSEAKAEVKVKVKKPRKLTPAQRALRKLEKIRAAHKVEMEARKEKARLRRLAATEAAEWAKADKAASDAAWLAFANNNADDDDDDDWDHVW